LPAIDMPVSEVAKALGVSRQQLHRILAETAPITPEMALRIGKFCGNGPDLWLRMQATCDLWHARQNLADKLNRIPTAKAKAAVIFKPGREMVLAPKRRHRSGDLRARQKWLAPIPA